MPLDKLVLVRVGGGCSPGGEVQLAEHITYVAGDGFLAYDELGGDRAIRLARR
jgi:hypothetical protein